MNNDMIPLLSKAALEDYHYEYTANDVEDDENVSTDSVNYEQLQENSSDDLNFADSEEEVDDEEEMEQEQYEEDYYYASLEDEHTMNQNEMEFNAKDETSFDNTFNLNNKYQQLLVQEEEQHLLQIYCNVAQEFQVFHGWFPSYSKYLSAELIRRGTLSKPSLIVVLEHLAFKDSLRNGSVGIYSTVPDANAIDKTTDYYLVCLIDSKDNRHCSIVPRCLKTLSKHSEEFILHLDHSNTLFHFDYRVVGHGCSPTGDDTTIVFEAKDTLVKVIRASIGVKPTLEYKKAANVNTGEKEEQSFIQKYWLYITLFFVMMLVNTFVPEPPQQSNRRANQK